MYTHNSYITSRQWQIWQTFSAGGSDSKESTCNVWDLSSIPGLERSPGGEHDNPL